MAATHGGAEPHGSARPSLGPDGNLGLHVVSLHWSPSWISPRIWPWARLSEEPLEEWNVLRKRSRLVVVDMNFRYRSDVFVC